MPHPLLSAWNSIVDRRSGEVAVVEVSTGGVWTFGELDASAREFSVGHAAGEGAVVYPKGVGVAFLIGVLAAWRTGKVVCPLEAEAVPPPPSHWDGLREAFPAAVVAKSTSGTTGEPRHVMFSASQLAADERAIVSTMGLGQGCANVAAISLAHSYGFSSLVLPLVLHGIPLVLAGSALPAAVRGALDCVATGMAGGRRAILPGVPALWSAWLAAEAVDAGRVAVAVSAGAPLPLEIERRGWSAGGMKIHNFLGSSECGGIAYDRTEVPREDGRVVGTAMDAVALTTDEEGRLLVRSDAVGLGYWPIQPYGAGLGGPDLQAGVFRTGDIAVWEEGGWRLLGRACDTVNLAGRKVHPAEVEAVLRGHDAVKECLVFGVPSADPSRGEELVAIVALKDQAASAETDLPSWIGRRLPSWKCPRHWWLRPDLAVTGRGKLPRADWRRRYLEDRAPASPG